MELETGTFIFEAFQGSGPRVKEESFSYNKRVIKAVAVLTGTDFGFSNNSDHHFGKAVFKLNTEINDKRVKVTGTFGVRDFSGNWDDPYEGYIYYVVLAELDDTNGQAELEEVPVEPEEATEKV